MKIQQIRNATLLIEYAGTRFLIDPALSKKGTYPAFPNSIRQELKNPLVNLPISIREILNVDAVIITHLHLDHFDEEAKKLLPKGIKIFVQNTADYDSLQADGFTNLEILTCATLYCGIHLSKTPGQHGSGSLAIQMGHVCGVVFQHPSEKTLYLAGDTIWYARINEVIQTYHPAIIVTNNGDNRLNDTPLVMGASDLLHLHQAIPHALLIANNMEAYNHWTLSREELRNFTIQNGFSSQVIIPANGETITL